MFGSILTTVGGAGRGGALLSPGWGDGWFLVRPAGRAGVEVAQPTLQSLLDSRAGNFSADCVQHPVDTGVHTDTV